MIIKMEKILTTILLGIFLISFVSASWIQKENIKYENLQVDDNVQIEYELKDNEFSFNLITPTKSDLALCVEGDVNTNFERNKNGVFEDVKEKEIKFIEGWCNDTDNYGYGKQNEDPNKAKYRITFLNYMSPFKLFAGTGTLISQITLFNFDYFEDEETNEFKVESNELINMKDLINFKT